MVGDSETRDYKLSDEYGVWGVFTRKELMKFIPGNEGCFLVEANFGALCVFLFWC